MHPDRLRALFVAIDARRWEALPDYLHPDIEYRRPGYEPLVGLEAVLDFYARVRVIASGTHHFTSILVDGDQIATFGRFVGVHRDGSPIDEEFAERLETDGTRIVRRQSYFFRPAV